MQLEQRLPVALVEFVQQSTPRRVGEGFEERFEIHLRKPTPI